MRVAIDATSLPPQPAGAAVYAIELVRALAEGDPRDGYALFTRGAHFDAHLNGRRNWRVERANAPSHARRLLWEQCALPGALSRLGIDVLHSTHHTLPVRPMRARRVVTVHDVTFFRLPQRYPPARRLYMQTMTRLSARVADAIIVPSETVKRDVIRTLGVPESKVSVVYEAAGQMHARVPSDKASAVALRYGVGPPFVLSVGSREPGKNRVRLFRAMRALRDRGIDVPLLVVGQPAWGYEDEETVVDELRMRDRITFAGYVPDADMPALYSAATMLAFPSLYEGFGLPVIEAMACGTPVLTSSISATAEISGDAALLVDPRSVNAIRDGLAAVLQDAALRDRLTQAGLQRAATFSWQRAAAETHAVYARALGAGG